MHLLHLPLCSCVNQMHTAGHVSLSLRLCHLLCLLKADYRWLSNWHPGTEKRLLVGCFVRLHRGRQGWQLPPLLPMQLLMQLATRRMLCQVLPAAHRQMVVCLAQECCSELCAAHRFQHGQKSEMNTRHSTANWQMLNRLAQAR